MQAVWCIQDLQCFLHCRVYGVQVGWGVTFKRKGEVESDRSKRSKGELFFFW